MSKANIRVRVIRGNDCWSRYIYLRVTAIRLRGTDISANSSIALGVKGKGKEIGLMFSVRNEQKEDSRKYSFILLIMLSIIV